MSHVFVGTGFKNTSDFFEYRYLNLEGSSNASIKNVVGRSIHFTVHIIYSLVKTMVGEARGKTCSTLSLQAYFYRLPYSTSAAVSAATTL